MLVAGPPFDLLGSRITSNVPVVGEGADPRKLPYLKVPTVAVTPQFPANEIPHVLGFSSVVF